MSELILELAKKTHPQHLKKQLWLRRDSIWNVISDLVFKGDWQNKYVFGRTHWILVTSSILGTLFIALITSQILQAASSILKFQFSSTNSWGFEQAVLACVGAITIYYWNTLKRYGDQWTYCSTIFNKIFYEKFLETENDLKEKVLKHCFRRTLFAIDVLDCGLWHHKSFYIEFNLALENAISSAGNLQNISGHTDLANLSDGKISISVARLYLSDFVTRLEKELIEF